MTQAELDPDKCTPMRVLLVHDDQVNAGIIVRALAGRGVSALWMRTIFETRSRIHEITRPRLDLALVDDQLPDGTGLELLPLLMATAPKPAVALITAAPSYERALAALKARQLLLPTPSTPDAWCELLELLHAQRDCAATSGAPTEGIVPRTFGGFVLEREGLLTPDGYIAMRPSEIQMFAFLLARSGRAASSAEIARQLFKRRDDASTDLVRRHIANLRQKLGPHGWLLELVPRQGYRLAPRAWTRTQGSYN